VTVRYFNNVTRKICRIKGVLPFTVYGHRFAVTRIQWVPGFLSCHPKPLFTITHLATGSKMGSLGVATPEEAKREGINHLHKIGRTKVLKGFKKVAKEPSAVALRARSQQAGEGARDA
jgi:hypothetical protein